MICRITFMFDHFEYGMCSAQLNTSQTTTPYAHTSDAVVYSLLLAASTNFCADKSFVTRPIPESPVLPSKASVASPSVRSSGGLHRTLSLWTENFLRPAGSDPRSRRGTETLHV